MTITKLYDTAHALNEEAVRRTQSAKTDAEFLAIIQLRITRDRLMLSGDIQNRANFLR